MFGKLRSRRNNKLRLETLEERHLLTSLPLISEIKLGDETTSYIEIEGEPNTTIPADTYFVAVYADQLRAGKIEAVVDLSGLQYGSNGFLVINQSGSPYSVDPNSSVITGVGGYSGLPDSRYSYDTDFVQCCDDNGGTTVTNEHRILRPDATYFLVEASAAPIAGTDYDTDDDGVLEGIAATWTEHDSISYVGGGILEDRGNETAYSNVVLRHFNGPGSVTLDELTLPAGATVIDSQDAYKGYIARLGTGSSERDWFTGQINGSGVVSESHHREFVGESAYGHLGTDNFPGAQFVGGSVGTYPGTGNFNDIAISEMRYILNSGSDFFLELAGIPDATIPQGTYIVQLDDIGVHKMVIDLGNLQVGSNGTITILSGGHGFSVNPDTTAITGTSLFDGLPDFRQQGGMIFPSNRSILVIQSPVRPRFDDNRTQIYDADWNNDGFLDDQAANWNVIDGISILGSHDGGATVSDTSMYADTVVRQWQTTRPAPNATLDMSVLSMDYINRIGQGNSPNDYIMGRTKKISGVYQVDEFGTGVYPPYPNPDVLGYALTHVGRASTSFDFPGGTGGETSGNNGGGGGDPVGEDIVGRTADGEWWAAVSDGTQFSNEFVAEWATNTGWHDVQIADVNGDGLDDIIGRNDSGDLYVSLADAGGQQTFQQWGNLSSSVTWEDVNAADVNGDGLSDLVGRANGQWWVAVSQGTYFTIEFWGRWSNSVDWEDVQVGDFDGDGLDDVAGRTSGDWWLARSTGQYFVTEFWGRWSNSVVWEDVIAADFDGDGRSDIAGRTNGDWWLARSSTNDHFVTEFWGRWSNSVAWQDVLTGDFNGDGRADLAGRANGDWWLARSSPNDFFVTEFWGRWADVAWADVSKGDFNGDGADDIAGRFGNDWWLQKSDSSKFQSEHWGSWGTTNWSDVKVGHHRGPRS